MGMAFEAYKEEDSGYAPAGGRLVAPRKENRNRASGAGERDESRVVKTLQLQS